MTTLVRVDLADGCLTITLDRPEKRNALNREMLDAIIAGVERARRDPDVRVVVLRGAGGYFSAGIDLVDAVAANQAASPIRIMRRVADMVVGVFRLPVPSIAVVEGGAYGLGANLALACDLTVAAADAVLCEVFIQRGLSVDGGGAWLLPRLVGLKRAKELVLFGDVIAAPEAAAMGLINHAVPAAELDGFVAGWVQRLGAYPPIALSLSKGLLNDAYERSFEQAAEDEGRAQTINARTEDAQEAFLAMAEKRPPRFSGR